MWDKRTAYTYDAGELFAFVTNSDQGKWAWFLIDQASDELIKSGSDDTEEAAKENAENALLEYDQEKSGDYT